MEINNDPSVNTDLPYPYSARLYKNGKIYTGFRSASPIPEDQAVEFFLDGQLLKRTKQNYQSYKNKEEKN